LQRYKIKALNTIIFSTGTNIAKRIDHLKHAENEMHRIGEIINISSVYESKAWGETNQQDFLNQVIHVETKLTAIECLDIIQLIEKERLRERKKHWGPRTLDIDILFFNNEIINSKRLIIPHAFIAERLFVLLPLSEILETFIHPVLGKEIKHLLTECKDESEIKLYKKAI